MDRHRPWRDASTGAMRRFWDAKARQNAMFYIHTELDFRSPDADEFWRSGVQNLEATLAPFGRRFDGTERVLDIGCGVGRITRAIAERAGSVVGLDVSAEMVERARSAMADCPNVEIVLGDGRGFGAWADGGFDVCYSFIVFQHIPDPAVTCGYIREIGRVLRPGGWTVFQVSEQPAVHAAATYRRGFAPRWWLRQLWGRAPRGTLAPQWLGSSLTREELLSALQAAGLVLASTVGDGGQFCLVHATKPAG